MPSAATRSRSAAIAPPPGPAAAGVGRARLERSLSEARELGLDARVLNLVFERIPPRGLWESAGFAEIGRSPRAIDGEQDALIYDPKL